MSENWVGWVLQSSDYLEVWFEGLEPQFTSTDGSGTIPSELFLRCNSPIKSV